MENVDLGKLSRSHGEVTIHEDGCSSGQSTESDFCPKGDDPAFGLWAVVIQQEWLWIWPDGLSPLVVWNQRGVVVQALWYRRCGTDGVLRWLHKLRLLFSASGRRACTSGPTSAMA